MDLRHRSKNRVVEAMACIVALLPIGQEPARPNCDVDIDRVDSVPEGCNESVKPLMQRVSPFRIAMANFFDDGFDLDQGPSAWIGGARSSSKSPSAHDCQTPKNNP